MDEIGSPSTENAGSVCPLCGYANIVGQGPVSGLPVGANDKKKLG